MTKKKLVKTIICKLVNIQSEVEAVNNYNEYLDLLAKERVSLEYTLTEQEWKEIKKLTIFWGLDLNE